MIKVSLLTASTVTTLESNVNKKLEHLQVSNTGEYRRTTILDVDIKPCVVDNTNKFIAVIRYEEFSGGITTKS
jgi:hypothetical protein